MICTLYTVGNGAWTLNFELCYCGNIWKNKPSLHQECMRKGLTFLLSSCWQGQPSRCRQTPWGALSESQGGRGPGWRWSLPQGAFPSPHTGGRVREQAPSFQPGYKHREKGIVNNSIVEHCLHASPELDIRKCVCWLVTEFWVVEMMLSQLVCHFLLHWAIKTVLLRLISVCKLPGFNWKTT